MKTTYLKDILNYPCRNKYFHCCEFQVRRDCVPSGSSRFERSGLRKCVWGADWSERRKAWGKQLLLFNFNKNIACPKMPPNSSAQHHWLIEVGCLNIMKTLARGKILKCKQSKTFDRLSGHERLTDILQCYNVKQGFKIKAYMRWFAEYNYHKKRKSSKMIYVKTLK